MSLKRSKSALNPAAGILTPRSKSGKEKKKEKSSAKRHKTAEIEKKPSMDDQSVPNDQQTLLSPIQSPGSTPITSPRQENYQQSSSPSLNPQSPQNNQNSSALQRSISVTHNNAQKSPPQALLADLDQVSFHFFLF